MLRKLREFEEESKRRNALWSSEHVSFRFWRDQRSPLIRSKTTLERLISAIIGLELGRHCALRQQRVRSALDCGGGAGRGRGRGKPIEAGERRRNGI